MLDKIAGAPVAHFAGGEIWLSAGSDDITSEVMTNSPRRARDLYLNGHTNDIFVLRPDVAWLIADRYELRCLLRLPVHRKWFVSRTLLWAQSSP